MPRIRSVKPELFTDADLAELSPLHRLFWMGLWGHQDREGRCHDKPRELKVKILPYDEADADAILWDLHERGFVIRYEVDGKRYIGTPGFKDHQRPHKDEKPSEIPGWEGATRRHRSYPDTPPGQLVVAKVEARPAEQITSAKSPEAVGGGGGGGGLLSLVSGGGAGSPPPSATKPPASGKTSSTDGEDESLPDALDAIHGSHRGGRPFPWGRNPVDAQRAVFDLAGGDAEEICRRLANALSVPRDKFPFFASAADLVKHWDHYAEPWVASGPRRADPNQGIPTRYE